MGWRLYSSSAIARVELWPEVVVVVDVAAAAAAATVAAAVYDVACHCIMYVSCMLPDAWRMSVAWLWMMCDVWCCMCDAWRITRAAHRDACMTLHRDVLHLLSYNIHLQGSMWCRTKKNQGNKRAGPSRDSSHFFDVQTKSVLTRPSADCQTTVFRGIKQLEEFLKKVAERSRDSGWNHATVGRLSNNVFGCFKQLENFLKKITERSRDSNRRSRYRGRRSRDHWPTVKQRFFDVSSN